MSRIDDEIARFGVTSIDTVMLRRSKRGLFPGCCESAYQMIDKLCHELEVTRAEAEKRQPHEPEVLKQCTLCHPEAKQAEPAFCSRHVLEILNSERTQPK